MKPLPPKHHPIPPDRRRGLRLRSTGHDSELFVLLMECLGDIEGWSRPDSSSPMRRSGGDCNGFAQSVCEKSVETALALLAEDRDETVSRDGGPAPPHLKVPSQPSGARSVTSSMSSRNGMDVSRPRGRPRSARPDWSGPGGPPKRMVPQAS